MASVIIYDRSPRWSKIQDERVFFKSPTSMLPDINYGLKLRSGDRNLLNDLNEGEVTRVSTSHVRVRAAVLERR